MDLTNSPSNDYIKQCIQCKQEFPRSFFISKRGTSICMLCKYCRKGHRDRQRGKQQITIKLIYRAKETAVVSKESKCE